MNDKVILVDNVDREIGTMEKLEAHQKGLLHRAFSIFLFNSKGELLMQQRADGKYHSAGLWSNTCCSHPAPNESTDDAVSRRLKQEMGLECAMSYAFSFTYKAAFSNGLIEHEFDHVYFGTSDDKPSINTEEVKDWKYVSIPLLLEDIHAKPWMYTEWLKDCIARVVEKKDLLKLQMVH